MHFKNVHYGIIFISKILGKNPKFLANNKVMYKLWYLYIGEIIKNDASMKYLISWEIFRSGKNK